jgi:hypothetical protein
MRELILIVAFISTLIGPAIHAEESMALGLEFSRADSSLSKAELQIQRTTRLALFIPGAGQVANRNYFKAVCAWAGMAYGIKFLIDNTDDLRNTREQLIAAVLNGSPIVNSLTERETYDQRYRDISWLVLFGIHGLSILDAHVSANLKTFDVSDDLSLRWDLLRVQNQSSLGLTLHWKIGNSLPPQL